MMVEDSAVIEDLPIYLFSNQINTPKSDTELVYIFSKSVQTKTIVLMKSKTTTNPGYKVCCIIPAAKLYQPNYINFGIRIVSELIFVELDNLHIWIEMTVTRDYVHKSFQ